MTMRQEKNNFNGSIILVGASIPNSWIVQSKPIIIMVVLVIVHHTFNISGLVRKHHFRHGHCAWGK